MTNLLDVQSRPLLACHTMEISADELAHLLAILASRWPLAACTPLTHLLHRPKMHPQSDPCVQSLPRRRPLRTLAH